MRSIPTVLVSCLLSASWMLAQSQSGLPPGSVVAATFGFQARPPYGPLPANHSLQSVDPYTGAAVPLVIAGFPSVPGEHPWAVLVESRLSFLVGTGRGPQLQSNNRWSWTDGNVYRVAWRSTGWHALRLNSNPIGEAVQAIAVVDDTIYATTTTSFSDGAVPGSKVWQMPRAGGTAAVHVDLTLLGAQGTGGAMVAVGRTLHVFTFVSASIAVAPGEHWAVYPSGAPLAQRLGLLPPSIRSGAGSAQFGALQAAWDDGQNLIVLGGVYGDVLWRDPTGRDVAQRALPTTLNQANFGDFMGSLTVLPETGAVLLGDKQRHLESLPCPRGRFHTDTVTLPLSADTWIIGLAAVPHDARHLVSRQTGCPLADGTWPCSHSDSLPRRGNAGFGLLLDSTAATAVLLIGRDDAEWAGRLLPLDLASLGAGGCALGTAIDVALPVVGPDPRVALPLPSLQLDLFTQWAVLDPLANSLGLVLSDTRRLQVR